MHWLRERVEREYVVERTGWAAERVQRVTERLQDGVEVSARLDTIVVWLSEYNAFTGPGRTIYVSRRLLELLDDESAAFVVAHELAHHRLGHVPPLSRGLRHIPMAILVALLASWIEGARRERDADLHAIELCIAAGYDPERCLAAFDHLARVALDYGDLDSALGPEDGGASSGRSHPDLQRRRADVQRHIAAMGQGHRLSDELAERRRRRTRTAWIAGGGAVAVVAIALWRRDPAALARLVRRR